MSQHVIPAILEEENTAVKHHVNRYETIKRIHVDVCDGSFVETKTPQGKSLDLPEQHIYELHLMVDQPSEVINDYDAEVVDRIFVHYEAESTQQDRVALGKRLLRKGIDAGLAVNPETEFEEYEPVLASYNRVLFLAVNPGKQGQELLHTVYRKIKELRGFDEDIPIHVDGGVKPEHLQDLRSAGATHVTLGSEFRDAEQPEALHKDLELRFWKIYES